MLKPKMIDAQSQASNTGVAVATQAEPKGEGEGGEVAGPEGAGAEVATASPSGNNTLLDRFNRFKKYTFTENSDEIETGTSITVYSSGNSDGNLTIHVSNKTKALDQLEKYKTALKEQKAERERLRKIKEETEGVENDNRKLKEGINAADAKGREGEGDAIDAAEGEEEGNATKDAENTAEGDAIDAAEGEEEENATKDAENTAEGDAIDAAEGEEEGNATKDAENTAEGDATETQVNAEQGDAADAKEGKNDKITTADRNKFTISRTAGDGNCFYTSIAKLIMNENDDDKTKYLSKLEIEGDPNEKNNMEAVRTAVGVTKPGQWATEEQIEKAIEVFNKHINVVQGTKKNEDAETIHKWHTDYNPYDTNNKYENNKYGNNVSNHWNIIHHNHGSTGAAANKNHYDALICIECNKINMENRKSSITVPLDFTPDSSTTDDAENMATKKETTKKTDDDKDN